MALSGSLSTPNLAAASSIPLPPSPHEDAYTILRTLHCTPSSTLALAVQSHGSLSSSSHALFAIRTCRRPLSRASSAERACLELVSSARIKNPYVEKMRRTWEDGPALYMVLDFHEGGSLLGYIDAQGPVGIQKTERWACETASGITFLHELGIIHSALRPSVIHLRANGHVVIGGFQYSILRSTSSNECPEAMEAIASANDPDPREWQEAPEILLDWEIGFEVDVWSFGIVLGWMVCGRVRRSLLSCKNTV
ncbi:kinase-like protein [Artomyces pyxidatus]|uniref:Kinase-like protein n=1 Tax=Artomyces pyxidatus TaxID=48021 RepID=A0ACB8T5J2_9AGAM|nr:kinase-like protein [Artomyces pyxidatus]